MSIKLIIFSCFLSVAFAGLLPYYSQPTIIKTIHAAPAEAPATYDFQYDVNDHSTGDVKAQRESAKNGAISGSYQLNDADGFLRIVDYTADDIHGFQANVRREPLIKKVIVAPAHNAWQPAAHNPWAYRAAW